ncbi:thiamine biosynthesis protein ApbE, partial [Pseudomonas aeruginosa]
LMVLGPEEGYRFAEKHRLAALFVSRQGNGFDSRTTPRYEQLFGNQGERP